MKLLQRYFLVIPLGILVGWLAGHLWFPGDRTLSGLPPVSAPVSTESSSLPSWQTWLDETVPLAIPGDAADFWSMTVASRNLPAGRRQLLRDEACVTMPFDSFSAVLEDPRSIEFNPPIRIMQNLLFSNSQEPSWWRRLAQEGPTAALGMTGRMPSPALNLQLQQLLSPYLARKDPEIGFAWVQSLNDPVNPLATFIGEVATIDIQKATELWRRLKIDESTSLAKGMSTAARDNSATYILEQLSRKDWKRAMTWAKENLSGEAGQKAISTLFFLMGSAQRESVLAAAEQMTDPVLRSITFSHMLAKKDDSAESLVAAALALPDKSLDRDGWEFLGQKSGGLALSRSRSAGEPIDPAATAAQIKGLVEKVPEAFREGFSKNAALMVAQNNRPVAARLLAFLPLSSIQFMAGQWVTEDPAAASTWLATVPPSPQRDAAVTGFCHELAPVDPASAAQWAVSLQDETLRTPAIQDAVGAWKQNDPAAAAAWVQEYEKTKLVTTDPKVDAP